MQIFTLLTIAHLVGDYPLQTNWVYARKVTGLVGGLPHAFILACCYVAALAPWLADSRVWVAILAIVLLHYVQDYAKIRLADRYKNRPAVLTGYVLDQVLHLTVLAGASFWLSDQAVSISSADWTALWQQDRLAWMIILALLLSFFWETTRFVWQIAGRHHQKFVRHWSAMFWRLTLGLTLFMFLF